MKLTKSLIFLYILIGLLPYMESVDKIHPQTLYLSILNPLSLLLIINNIGLKKLISSLTQSISKTSAFFYFLYLGLSLLSLNYSYNLVQSYIQLTEIVTIFFTFLILIYLVSTLKDIYGFFINTVIVLTVIELIFVFIPYLTDIIEFGSPFNRSLEYRGTTGSVNIASYLLLMKLPFIYDLTIKRKHKLFYIILSILSLYAIVVIFQTRSAILLSFIVSSVLILMYCYNIYISKTKESYSLINVISSIVLPTIVVLLLSNFQANYFNATESVQERLSSINIQEYSTNARVRYYSQAISSIVKKPFTGVGIGNWQLESIDTDRDNIESYIVPYHVHNDFLEISAEVGIIGAIFYYLVYLSIAYFLLKKIIMSIKRRKPLGVDFLFLLVLGIYFVDSMFNFPIGRILQQVNLLFIVAFLINYYQLGELKISNNLNKVILVFMVLSIPLTIYSSSRQFISSKHQKTLLSHYNLGDFSIPLEIIDEFEMEYSDLTVTTIPMKSLKGFFYMKNKKFREAIDLFNEGTRHNPQLYFSESYKAYSFLMINELDSAYYFSKLAFEKLPGNVVHFANYALSLTTRSDSLGLINAYNKATFKKEFHDEIYLTAMADIINKDDNNFALENFDLNAESGNENLKRSYYTLKIGRGDMITAANLNVIGDAYFQNKDFVNAERFFRQASEINPYEFPYIENYANTKLKLGKYEEALDILNDLIDVKESKSIIAKYMRVLAYLNLKDNEQACIFIEEIKDYPLFQSLELARFCL